MNQTRNFRTEYEAFIQKYPYKTIDVNGVKVRYQYGGKKDAPVLLFFHGLEMQEIGQLMHCITKKIIDF